LPNPPTLTLAAAGSWAATVVLHSSRHATKAASRRLATLSVSGHWTVKQALIRRAKALSSAGSVALPVATCVVR